MRDFDVWGQLALLWNVGIVAGYLIVPATALRLIPVRAWVRLAGVGFFFTCSMTHLYMGYAGENHANSRDLVWWLMFTNHLVQVICLWCFLLGLSSAVRAAVTTRRRRRAASPGVNRDSAGHEQRRG